jgi:hypothetical protein
MSASPQQDFDFERRARHRRAVYFNTTQLCGDALASARRDARKQDVLVLSIMRGDCAPLTPSEVWRAGTEAGSDWLLTSVRRSMNTLTHEGLLRKMDAYKPGPYGRPERLWCTCERGSGQ